MKIVVLGGGAAGGTAAQFAKKTDRKAEITIVDSEPYGQYSRCGLPYALRGDTSREELVEFSPEWFEKRGIKALYGWKCTKADFSSKSVRIERAGESMKLPYDRLIICTGARPWMPPIKGADSGGVFFLRTLSDLEEIEKNAGRGKKAVVVGAGLIGLESAESLMKRGLDVSVVEFLPGPLRAMFDEDMGDIVDSMLKENGVKAVYGSEVVEIRGNPAKSVIIRERESGKTSEIEAELVIIATGNIPYTEVFEGIEKGKKGHIRVNSRSETSVPDVYAAGDCTEYTEMVTGSWVPMGMGTMAVRQGMAAGINAGGGDFEIQPFTGTRVTEIFGIRMGAVGPVSHSLGINGKEFVSARYRGESLPAYMHGEKLAVKVLADKEGRIIGAQIIGPDAPWRISMFAEAIATGDTAEHLSTLETPYAPPISPTLDPTIIACGMVAARVRRGR